MPNYLHNHPEFQELIRTVAHEKGIQDTLVAKDYWIMHVLYSLKDSGFVFQLKGGTSLSKGFGIIGRFSEDIDILIEPPEGMDVKTGKNHEKPAHCESRKKYYDWLAKEIAVDGIENIERDTEFDDKKKYWSGGIRLHYPLDFGSTSGLKEGVLLEAGFDKVTPNQAVDISSWALAFAIERKIDVLDNTAVGVVCYDSRYTFVEKLQTIAKKYMQQQEKGALSANFIRHYYDVMCLLKEDSVQDFIGTAAYKKHKSDKFVGQLRDMDIPKSEAFLLSNEATRNLYKKEYEKTKDLYYQGQPSFEEILGVIKENLDRL